MNKETPTENNGSLSNKIFQAINEHTVGGFIIFYYNQKTGRPEQLLSFDSPAHALAMQKHIADWSEILHAANIENSVAAMSIFNAISDPSQLSDDEEDGEGGE